MIGPLYVLGRLSHIPVRICILDAGYVLIGPFEFDLVHVLLFIRLFDVRIRIVVVRIRYWV